MHRPGSDALPAFRSVHKDYLSPRFWRSATIINDAISSKMPSPAKQCSMAMFFGDVADKRRWVSEIYLQSLGTLAASAMGQVSDDKASPCTPPTTCLAVMLLEYRQSPNLNFQLQRVLYKDAKRARAEAMFWG